MTPTPYNDDLPYYTQVGETVPPDSFTYNGARGSRTRRRSSTSADAGLDYLWDEGATHPRMDVGRAACPWAGQAGGNPQRALRDFIEHALQKGDVAPCACRWNDHHEEFPTG